MQFPSDWRTTMLETLQHKDWRAAQAMGRSVLEERPAEAQAWVWLGEALEHQGKGAAAWHCYDRGWMLDPQAVWAPAAEKRLSQWKGQDEGRLEWLERLLEVPKVRVVAAILAKDEAEHIHHAVSALMPAVDEVWVVDTGSQDNTVELAEQAGARVIHTEWANDFGKARRAADPHLGDDGWVLWVDADEFLDADDLAVPRVAAGLFDQVEPPLLLRVVQVNYLNDRVEHNFDITRMYPLGKGLTWKGRIHEQVVFADAEKHPFQRGAVRIRLDHRGYMQEVMASRGKFERNIELLKAWTDDEPENPAAWGFLGRDLYAAGNIEEAIPPLYRAEALAAHTPEYARTPEVRSVLCEILDRLKRWEEARQVADRAVKETPDHPMGWYWKARFAILQADQLAAEAQQWAQKCREVAPTYRGIVSFNPDVPGMLAPIIEADSLRMRGNWRPAYDVYRTVLDRAPQFDAVRQQIERMQREGKEVLAAARAPSSATETVSEPHLARRR